MIFSDPTSFLTFLCLFPQQGALASSQSPNQKALVILKLLFAFHSLYLITEFRYFLYIVYFVFPLLISLLE